jgi:hypothetical protein
MLRQRNLINGKPKLIAYFLSEDPLGMTTVELGEW